MSSERAALDVAAELEAHYRRLAAEYDRPVMQDRDARTLTLLSAMTDTLTALASIQSAQDMARTFAEEQEASVAGPYPPAMLLVPGGEA